MRACIWPKRDRQEIELGAIRLRLRDRRRRLVRLCARRARDDTPSFFLAETLKYFYLSFSPAGELDLKKVVFNSAAHPSKRAC